MTTTVNFTKYSKSISLIFSMILAAALLQPAQAQEFSLGADIMNRYIWRGTDFGNSPSIQPSLTFITSGFEIGTWGAYPFSQQSFEAVEHDLYASYTIDTGNGSSFSLGVTDYYFPFGGVDFFNYDGNGAGAHMIEPYLSYTGPSSLPITVYGGIFAHNDPDNSIYLEVGYPVYSGDTSVYLTVGGTPLESAFYQTGTAGIMSINLSASRVLQITEALGLPLTASYILNPYHEQSFLLFGFRL